MHYHTNRSPHPLTNLRTSPFVQLMLFSGRAIAIMYVMSGSDHSIRNPEIR